MRIFLIGFMGCGKSFIGQKLAQLAGLPFYDLDGYIESKTDMPIPQIFAQHGEPHFRALEQQHLHHFAQLNAFVLSCGGGTPCFYDNIDWINAQGISVYLNCPPELLSTRLLTDAMASFDEHCAQGMASDRRRIDELLQRSLMRVTALAPHIGYERAAQIAQHALAHDLSLREAALALGFVTAGQLDAWLE